MTEPRYLTVAAFKAWARDEVTADDDVIEASINATEESIDGELQRRIALAVPGAPGLTTRLYRPDGPTSRTIHPHDCTEVTEIVENGVTLVEGTDYQLEPLNGLNDAGEPVPYDTVRRLGGRFWHWDQNKATLSITLRPGWASFPALVIDAAKIITNDDLANRNTRFGLAGITETAGIRMRENPTVEKMIDKYRHITTYGNF